jgi:hypothetical protein
MSPNNKIVKKILRKTDKIAIGTKSIKKAAKKPKAIGIVKKVGKIVKVKKV